MAGQGWYEARFDPTLNWVKHTIHSYAKSRNAVADIDKDGNLDIIACEGESSSGRLAWFEAPEDPRTQPFVEHLITTTLDHPHSLAAVDFDRDGDVDVMVGEMGFSGSQKRMMVYENTDGQGTFEARVLTSGYGTHEAKVGDFDGDGDIDIVGKPYLHGQVDWWENIGTFNVDWWENIGTFNAIGFEFAANTVDSSRPYRGHFIFHADVDDDGLEDIVTGKWWYKNPSWVRYEIPTIGQVSLIYDIDHDRDLDLFGTIGSQSNDFVWMEQIDAVSGLWEAHTLGEGNGDWVHGAVIADIVPGGNPEFVFDYHNGQNGLNGVEYFEIPDDPSNAWIRKELDPFSYGEGIDAADLDRDGDVDIVLGPTWFENNGGGWIRHDIVSAYTPDRVKVADINSDGKLDIVFTEDFEFAGQERVVWLEAPVAAASDEWIPHVISGPGGSLPTLSRPLNLNLADFDRDGDIDIVTGEHAGSNRLVIYENSNKGLVWNEHVIDTGKEHHVGTEAFDYDRDGDLDIISHGWSVQNYVYLWRNSGVAHDGPPTASIIASPLSGETPLVVNFDASNSSTPSGRIVGYKWVFESNSNDLDELFHIVNDWLVVEPNGVD